jgi:hypothetical protein
MPRFPKGSEEAKEAMRKVREARMKKRAEEIREMTGIESIDLPIMNKVELNIPPVFAYMSKGKKKLANPTTQERNLSSRRNTGLSIDIKRKPIEKPVILAETANIKPEDLTPSQLQTLLKYASDIENNRGKPINEIRSYDADPVRERGRPKKLPKNIEWHRQKKEARRRRQPEETKEEREDVGEEKEADPVAVEQALQRNKRAYVRRETEADKREAILEQKRRWARENYAKKKAEREATGGNIFTAPITTIQTAYQGREDYPPRDRELLKKFGDELVASLTIKRTPVASAISSALNAVSMGKFGRRLGKKDYDTLFHLFLEIITTTGRKFLIEKNEAINFEKSPKDRPNTEQFVVSNIPTDMTINKMLEETKNYMGKKYFKYDATSNNCQDFILSIFNANHFGTDAEKKFIKQDTESLFKNLDKTSYIAKKVTDLGGTFNVLTKGAGMVRIDTYRK